jgi:hypothetical protein
VGGSPWSFCSLVGMRGRLSQPVEDRDVWPQTGSTTSPLPGQNCLAAEPSVSLASHAASLIAARPLEAREVLTVPTLITRYPFGSGSGSGKHNRPLPPGDAERTTWGNGEERLTRHHFQVFHLCHPPPTHLLPLEVHPSGPRCRSCRLCRNVVCGILFRYLRAGEGNKASR